MNPAGGRKAVVIDLSGLDTGGPDGAVWSLPAGGDLNANLVKLGPGGRIDRHRNAEVDVVMVVVDGAGELTVDDETHPLRPDVLAHIPKGAERQTVAGPTGLVYLSLHKARGGLQIRAPKAGRQTAITWFEDPPYEFLSNFHPAPVRLDAVEHPTVEHAYQAAKTLDRAEREHVRSAPTPAEAKERGRHVTVRPDWNDHKIAVMRHLLVQKFSDPVLRERLAATAPLQLIEGNTWGDRFWGVYEGEGENWLGRLLMEIRDAGTMRT